MPQVGWGSPHGSSRRGRRRGVDGPRRQGRFGAGDRVPRRGLEHGRPRLTAPAIPANQTAPVDGPPATGRPHGHSIGAHAVLTHHLPSSVSRLPCTVSRPRARARSPGGRPRARCSVDPGMSSCRLRSRRPIGHGRSATPTGRWSTPTPAAPGDRSPTPPALPSHPSLFRLRRSLPAGASLGAPHVVPAMR